MILTPYFSRVSAKVRRPPSPNPFSLKETDDGWVVTDIYENVQGGPFPDIGEAQQLKKKLWMMKHLDAGVEN